MPIHIDEIIVSASIVGAQSGAKGGGNTGGDDKAKEKIIAECVEQVMHLLERKNQR